MDGRLKDRIALVTGGAQGIGLGIATRLAGEGAHVILADIKADAARAAAQDLTARGLQASHAALDIADDASCAALAKAVAAAHGRLDILVNNAAIGDEVALDDLTIAHHLRVIDINQHGAVRVTLALLPLLRHGRHARRILNIASIMGMRGSPGTLPYSTSKGGIVNFTRALAADLAPEGILVNAIAPGFVDTPMAVHPDGRHDYDTDWFRDIYIKWGRIPLRRFATPEDIAGPAFFLCSDDCRYVTGQILLVDGGCSAVF